MINKVFYNCDGDMLIIPSKGILYIATEFGKLTVKQREIVVIPRSVKFSVEVTSEA